MRVILAGKHELACRLAAALEDCRGLELGFLACATEADHDGGRESLKALLSKRDHRPLNDDYGHEDLLHAVRRFQPNVLISAGYDRIFRPELLASVPLALNIHFSLLPRYRGCYSLPWAMLNDDSTLGVTVHHIDSGIDSGPIVVQSSFPNDRGQGCKALYLTAVECGVQLALRLMEDLKAGVPPQTRPQDESLATYHPPRFPGDFRITWRQTISTVTNYIRATHFPPYQPAISTCGEWTMGFEPPVRVLPDPGQPLAPGTIALVGEHYAVAALNGLVLPGLVHLNEDRLLFSDAVRRLGLAGRRLT